MARLVIVLLLTAFGAFAQDAPSSTPTPAPVTADDRLYDEVRNVLAYDHDVRGAAIDVIVENGAIVLRGRVRDQKAREKATKLTQKVKGVVSVKNELKLFTEK